MGEENEMWRATRENNTEDGRGERTNTNWGLLGIVVSFFRCILPELFFTGLLASRHSHTALFPKVF